MFNLKKKCFYEVVNPISNELPILAKFAFSVQFISSSLFVFFLLIARAPSDVVSCCC
jgi:hypothetical protein